MNKLSTFIFGAVCAIVFQLAMAEPACAGGLRLGIMPSSMHWTSENAFNERHDGVFLELKLSDSNWIGAMKYDNSFNRTSNLGYYLRDNSINDHMSWGYMFGGVTGYNPDRPILFGALTFTLRLGPVAQRTLIIPLVVNAYQAYVEF